MRSAPLDDIKAIKQAAGTTVNDVVMAVCAGALRHYLLDRQALPDRPLVGMVPVSTRTGAETDPWTNRVSAMFPILPTASADPVDRLRQMQQTMNEAKDRFSLVPADVLSDYAEFAPPALFIRAARVSSQLRLADRFNAPFNLVISNVPGPRHPLYLAGARMLHYYPVSTIVDGQGINITVQSYGDILDFGLVSCRELVPDLEDLADLLVEEIAVLARRSPTGSAPDAHPAPCRLNARTGPTAEAATARRPERPNRPGPTPPAPTPGPPGPVPDSRGPSRTRARGQQRPRRAAQPGPGRRPHLADHGRPPAAVHGVGAHHGLILDGGLEGQHRQRPGGAGLDLHGQLGPGRLAPGAAGCRAARPVRPIGALTTTRSRSPGPGGTGWSTSGRRRPRSALLRSAPGRTSPEPRTTPPPPGPGVAAGAPLRPNTTSRASSRRTAVTHSGGRRPPVAEHGPDAVGDHGGRHRSRRHQPGHAPPEGAPPRAGAGRPAARWAPTDRPNDPPAPAPGGASPAPGPVTGRPIAGGRLPPG